MPHNFDELIFMIPKNIGKLIFQYVGSLDPAAQLISDLKQSFNSIIAELSLEMHNALLASEHDNFNSLCQSSFWISYKHSNISAFPVWALLTKYDRTFMYGLDEVTYFNTNQKFWQMCVLFYCFTDKEYKEYFFNLYL
jgi:hypothetical protein